MTSDPGIDVRAIRDIAEGIKVYHDDSKMPIPFLDSPDGTMSLFNRFGKFINNIKLFRQGRLSYKRFGPNGQERIATMYLYALNHQRILTLPAPGTTLEQRWCKHQLLIVITYTNLRSTNVKNLTPCTDCSTYPTAVVALRSFVSSRVGTNLESAKSRTRYA